MLINGEEFIGNLYEIEGKALLTVCDEWGNTCDYNLTVIRKAPEILYAVGEGSINPVVYERTYYLKDKVTVSISDGFDEMAMFSVYDEKNNLIGNFSIGETHAFTSSGKYTVEAVNHYGESETFTLVISLDAPKVSVTKNGEAFTYELGKEITEPAKYTVKVTDAIGNTSEFSFTIVEAEVGKFDQEIDNVAGFEKVLVNGAEATLDRGSLILTESGTYEVAIVANGVSRTFTVTVDATAPSISLNGVENGGETKDAVIIDDLSEDATVKVTKDGEEIAYKLGDEITEPGEYTATSP